MRVPKNLWLLAWLVAAGQATAQSSATVPTGDGATAQDTVEASTAAMAEVLELIADWEATMEAFNAELREIPRKERRAFRENYEPKPAEFTRRFLELADANSGSKVALTAFLWVAENDLSDENGETLIAEIASHHANDPEAAGVLEAVGTNPSNVAHFRRLVQESTSPENRLQAALALGDFVKDLYDIATLLTGPRAEETESEYRGYYGDATVDMAKASPWQSFATEVKDIYAMLGEQHGDLETRAGTMAVTAARMVYEMENLTIGKVAPEITAEDIDGVVFNLSDYRGKVVVLDFWGDW